MGAYIIQDLEDPVYLRLSKNQIQDMCFGRMATLDTEKPITLGENVVEKVRNEYCYRDARGILHRKE